MAPTSLAVTKALKRLESSLDAAQTYEGHELFKTAFHRCRARKQLEDSYDLAEGGAVLQLKKGQVNCGIELGRMLIVAYNTDNVAANDVSLERIIRIIKAYPTSGDATGEANEIDDNPMEPCSQLVRDAMKWLYKVQGNQFGPTLSGALAVKTIEIMDWHGLGIALPQFARSFEFSAFAAAIATAARQGLPEEEDLFIARAVLTIVATKVVCEKETGLTRAGRFLEMYPIAAGHDVPGTPLMHFLTLYLEALRYKSSLLVEELLQRYRVVIDRDISLMELIKKSRQMYNASPPVAANAFGGMLGGLLRGMSAV